MSEAEQQRLGAQYWMAKAASECRATYIYILRERWPGYWCHIQARHANTLLASSWPHPDEARQPPSAPMTIMCVYSGRGQVTGDGSDTLDTGPWSRCARCDQAEGGDTRPALPSCDQGALASDEWSPPRGDGQWAGQCGHTQGAE